MENALNLSKKLQIGFHGELHSIDTEGLTPSTTLNEYIRNHLHLTGTKYLCKEGGCGSCIVAVTAKNPCSGVRETFAVNSCLVSILSCNGWDIKTIESLGNRADGYHEIQEKIVKYNGTQCGFCTPGMIMNMYALQESGSKTMAEIENAFGGNLCRCTGYRPILTAFKSLASDMDEKLLGTIPDIEELKICKKTPNCAKKCPIPCRTNFPMKYHLGLENSPIDGVSKKIWYKVDKCAQIFNIINSSLHADKRYMLVAGNTAHGIYEDINEVDYYVDIRDVEELRFHALSTEKLTLGGNVTLTDMMNVCSNVAKNDDGFVYLAKLVTHLDKVATVPVRNIGTIAGNLTLKYLHKDFPSDVFLLLETVNARIIIDDGKNQTSLSPNAYINTNMTNKIIRRIELFPLDKSYKLQTYKIMPRAQNSHAYVNAGFLFKMKEDTIVESATMVFGGISSNFSRAQSSSAYIYGKRLDNNANLQNLFKNLSRELNPTHTLPEPAPEYRRQLAIALTYKCILGILPESALSSMNKSAAQELIRPAVSRGVQDFVTNESMYPVGEPINKLEAADQASGSAKYVLDLPLAHNQTYAAFVMANVQPRSILKKIDASNALALNGVETFLQASDIPGVNSFMAPNNPIMYSVDEAIFIPIGGEIKFYGQAVGIIVAKSQEIAEKAANLVDLDFEESSSSPLLTVRDVIANNVKERIVHHTTIVPKHQDEEVPVKFKGTFDVDGQYHFHMETQTVLVNFEDNGTLNIWPTAQWMDGMQFAISRALNFPASKISITVNRVGGAFGARITRTTWLACAASLAALKLQKPVKFSLKLSTNMELLGKRNGATGDYDVGVDANGKIGYLNYDIYNDVGCYENSLPFMQTIDAVLNNYASDSFQLDYNYVRTDKPAATWCRSPGAVEGIAMLETVLEHIAYKTYKDPVDVRLANLDEAKHPVLKKMFDEFLPWSDYRARRAEIDAFNAANRWRKRGIGCLPISITLQFVANHYAQVSIYQADGTVAISHGGVEMGQGINTKVVQVAAYELGIHMDQIQVKPTNNFNAPNNMASGGSLTTESVCKAVQVVCQTLKQRIDAARTQNKLPEDTPWLNLIKNAFQMGVNLSANHMWIDNPQAPGTYVIHGIGATEVEIDILTGNYIIQRVDLMEDAGDSSNPYIDIGQVEGAFIMGMGYWTTEQLIMDHDGRLTTNKTWNYKPPGAKDIPVDFRVKLPSGQPNPASPYKNKATSEPPTCLGFSVALAIKHALATARTQSDANADPWIPINGPFTIESIFMNSLNDFKQYQL